MRSKPRTLMHCGRILHSWLVLAIVASVTAYGGSFLLSDLLRFDADRGDRFEYPSEHYLQVLVATPDGELRRVSLDELAQFKTANPHSSLSLWLPASAATIELRTPRANARLDYDAVKVAPDVLRVETRYSDSEWSIISRYLVEDERITPIYCRSWSAWLIAQAFLYIGLPLALLVWLLGYLLQKHEERVLQARGERPYMQHRYRLT